MTREKTPPFRFQILQKIAVLSTDSTGWTKEVNLISYNDKKPVLDIRKWSPKGKMGRGITLKATELEALQEVLATLQIEQGEINYGYGN